MGIEDAMIDTIEHEFGAGGFTTAKAAARLSGAESDAERQFTDRTPSHEFTRGNNRRTG